VLYSVIGPFHSLNIKIHSSPAVFEEKKSDSSQKKYINHFGISSNPTRCISKLYPDLTTNKRIKPSTAPSPRPDFSNRN
jgi:hypothetical protein